VELLGQGGEVTVTLALSLIPILAGNTKEKNLHFPPNCNNDDRKRWELREDGTQRALHKSEPETQPTDDSICTRYRHQGEPWCSPRGGQKAPGGRDITSPGRNLREREFVCVGALPSDLEIRSSGSIPSATDAQSNGAGSFTSAWLEVTKKKGTNIRNLAERRMEEVADFTAEGARRTSTETEWGTVSNTKHRTNKETLG